MSLMLNNPGQEVGGPEVSPDEAQSQRSGVGVVFAQILLIVLAGLYLFGVVWLYIQMPWLALVATGVAGGIVLSGIVSRMRTPPDDHKT